MKEFYQFLVFLLILTCPLVNAQTLKSTIRSKVHPYGQVSDKLIKEYDENGHLIKMVVADFRGIVTQTSFYIVDDKGRMISDSTYDADNKLTEVCSYAYNEHDAILLQKRRYLDERNVYYEERFERIYNSKGLETEVKQFNIEGGLDWVYKYKYDSKGNELKRISFFRGALKEEWRQKYKGSNYMVRKVYGYYDDNMKGKLGGIWAYEYGEQGRMSKRTSYDLDKEDKYEVTEYDYDEAGNVVEETTRNENGRIVYVVKFENRYW